MKKLTLAVLKYDLEQVQKSIDEHNESLAVAKQVHQVNHYVFTEEDIEHLENKISQFTEVKANLEACIAWVNSKPE